MGHRIDKLVLLSLLAGALYVFFIGAMSSIPLAAGAAFFAMALLRRLARPFSGNRSARSSASREALARRDYLAVCDEAEAREHIIRLIECAYSGQLDGITTSFILRHPSAGPLTYADICAEWKKHREHNRLLIASLQKAGDNAFASAACLQNPEVRLIDGDMLLSLMEHNLCSIPLMPNPPRIRCAAAVVQAACRARAGKCALTGLVMVLLYFMTGATAYLAGSLLILFIACVSAHQRSRPAKLFT